MVSSSIKTLEGEDPCAFRVLTGCSDDKISGYRVRLGGRDYAPGNDETLLDDDEVILEYYGDIIRSTARSDNDKCTHLAVGPSVVAAQSGKCLEIFRLRGVEETKRKLKKRLKKTRIRAKNESGEAWVEDAWGDVSFKRGSNSLRRAGWMRMWQRKRGDNDMESYARRSRFLNLVCVVIG